MEGFLPVLCNSLLFRGMDPKDLPFMLDCLNARRTRHARQGLILCEGERVSELGVVLSGQAQITKDDYMGNRTIIADLLPGDMFAEAYAFRRELPIPINVVSLTESEILWLDCGRITGICPQVCDFHTRLVENLLFIMASKNILLNRKIDHLSKRTTREKLLSYLSDQAFLQGSKEFDIPFNRQELADYLCVDRSAMSSELSRMQAEGLIRYQRNHFSFPSDR
ncbi:MAG: Crp/Fnr family transcriptional regulator [Christensenellales bacterium]|jgi:CRP-like cAMP-binding protein